MLFENEYTDFLIFNFHNEVLKRNVGLIAGYVIF